MMADTEVEAIKNYTLAFLRFRDEPQEVIQQPDPKRRPHGAIIALWYVAAIYLLIVAVIGAAWALLHIL